MTWIPDVTVPDRDKFMEQVRRMRQEAIKMLEGQGYLIKKVEP